MSNHTQGKWEPWRDEDGAWGVVCNGAFITTAFPPDLGGLDGTEEANARLIAAAPELLAALKAAMNFIDVHVADPDITDEMCRAWEALQKANPRAAIAKAEGGQDE